MAVMMALEQAELPAVPTLAPGSPKLAQQLAATLAALRQKPLSEAEIALYRAGLALLEAQPGADAAIEMLGDMPAMRTEAGGWTPVNRVNERDKLVDEFVRTHVTGALALSRALAEFRVWTFDEAGALLGTLAQDYGVEVSGGGNVTFTSFDRRYKVMVTRQTRIAFGPELEVARELLVRWVAEAEGSADLKMLITDAFRLDEQGRVKADEVLRLRRYAIESDLWRRAMAAITDAMIVAAKKDYVRFYQRRADGGYVLIPLDLANA